MYKKQDAKVHKRRRIRACALALCLAGALAGCSAELPWERVPGAQTSKAVKKQAADTGFIPEQPGS